MHRGGGGGVHGHDDYRDRRSPELLRRGRGGEGSRSPSDVEDAFYDYSTNSLGRPGATGRIPGPPPPMTSRSSSVVLRSLPPPDHASNPPFLSSSQRSLSTSAAAGATASAAAVRLSESDHDTSWPGMEDRRHGGRGSTARHESVSSANSPPPPPPPPPPPQQLTGLIRHHSTGGQSQSSGSFPPSQQHSLRLSTKLANHKQGKFLEKFFVIRKSAKIGRQ